MQRDRGVKAWENDVTGGSCIRAWGVFTNLCISTFYSLNIYIIETVVCFLKYKDKYLINDTYLVIGWKFMSICLIYLQYYV